MPNRRRAIMWSNVGVLYWRIYALYASLGLDESLILSWSRNSPILLENAWRKIFFYTLGNPFAYSGITITRPFCCLRGNVHFDWFVQYLCTREHFQSDLDIFQFHFMFVKPRDVPPLLCVNVQTEMRFRLKQLILTTPALWKQEQF